MQKRSGALNARVSKDEHADGCSFPVERWTSRTIAAILIGSCGSFVEMLAFANQNLLE